MEVKLPKGFQLATASAGFKKAERKDLSLAVSDVPAVAAGVFTTNAFKAAPVLVGQEIIAGGAPVRAVLVNTGQANACTGDEGLANCRKTMELIAENFGISSHEVLPASTGVIGAQLKMDLWQRAMPSLRADLGKSSTEEFAKSIMTTDSFPKFVSHEIELAGGKITLTGFAKGAGMICPNMATMIALVLCDVKIGTEEWQGLFIRAVGKSFNRATVDGDTSTNDTLYGLANGVSGVEVTAKDIPLLEQSLVDLLKKLAYMLVQDGEGATKVMHIKVRGAKRDAEAELIARTVGHSPLVKTAMYGKDANWGRIVAAVGRSGANFDPAKVRVSICGVEVFANEQPTNCDFDALLKEPLQGRDIEILITVGEEHGRYSLMASDLTHEYVSINADYRS